MEVGGGTDLASVVVEKRDRFTISAGVDCVAEHKHTD